MIRHSEQSTRQYAHIWSDNLQLPNVLVYNLQLPYKSDGPHGRDGPGQPAQTDRQI